MDSDLLFTVFDSLDLSTLCASSRVSRLWRMVARAHPSFWKSLSLDDSNLTCGSVEQFLDRLTARQEPDATISLSLRCTAPRRSLTALVLSRVVLPAVREQLRRVEDLKLVVSPAFAVEIWPWFHTDAPHLRSLLVLLNDCSANIDPPPAFFNAHAHSSLEEIHLDGVPLPVLEKPLGHALRSVRAVYSDSHFPLLQRLLAWMPHGSHRLSLRLRKRKGRPLQLPGSPALSAVQISTVQHFVLHHAAWLAELPHHVIPVMTICVFTYAPGRARMLLPQDGPLALYFRRRYVHSDWDTNSGLGSMVMAAPDSSWIRDFSTLRNSVMGSLSFIQEVVHADRLVVLASPLNLTFRTLCTHGYVLPRLEDLRLLLNALPEASPGWDGGRVACPRLVTLTFHKEFDHEEATTSTWDLRAFIQASIGGEYTNPLRVILHDVGLTGGLDLLGDMELEFQARAEFARC